MDIVDYKESTYDDVVEEVEQLLKQVQFNTDDASFIPISAFEGDNIAEESDNTPWYDGEILLEALNNLPEPEPPTDAPLRLPIQDVYTISGIGTVPVGRIETGLLNTGDNVVPSSPATWAARSRRSRCTTKRCRKPSPVTTLLIQRSWHRQGRHPPR